MVGFATATAYRGLRLIRFPSTSLSQGDGGVGVKNGVNYFGKKNWVGTFSVPDAVVNDFSFLKALPSNQKRAGFIEAVKVALIRDRSFLNRSKKGAEELANFKSDAMEQVIRKSAAFHLGSYRQFGRSIRERFSQAFWISVTGLPINLNNYPTFELDMETPLLSDWQLICFIPPVLD